MQYAEILRARVETLDAELNKLRSEAATLVPDETRDAAACDVRADEIIARANELKAERESAKARLAEFDELERSATAAAGTPQFMRRVEPAAPTEVRALSRMEARDHAMKTIELQPSYLVNDENRDHLARLVDTRNKNFDGDLIARQLVLTENEHYRNGWAKTLSPTPVYTSDEARALLAFDEFRAGAHSLTDASGGYAVPVLIDPTIILTSGAADVPLLRVCRVEQITGNTWRGVGAAGTAWSTDGEGVTVSEDGSTFSQPTVTAYKGAGFIPFTIEIGMDYPNFAAEMRGLLEQGYMDWLAVKTATGSGTDLQGWFTALDANASSEVAVTSDGVFQAADIDKIWAALPEKWRSRAIWFMNVDVENEIRGFGSGTATSRFTVDQTAAGISALNGRPVVLSDYAPTFTGTTGASNILICGDPKTYLVAQRAGMTVEVVQHLVDVTYNRPTGQRGLYAWARAGADSVNDPGARLLQNT